ncbi:MAG: nitroreductase [Rhodobacteraceae bacterium]|nr:nitroreductase [Paracoccaceae bacterium]
MPESVPEVLAFLKTRRSTPAKTLRPPVPSREELSALLEIAARSPDHKKLEPWHFIVLAEPALRRLGPLAEARYDDLGLPAEKRGKACSQFNDGHLAVAVIASPVIREDVPEIEQTLSAGAVCLALLNGALASGWGANWLSGPMAFDHTFLKQGLGVEPHEFVAGFIHIGSRTAKPPERPRPDIAALTKWVDI